MKILIADDDENCRALLEGYLSRFGEIQFAATGGDAVRAVEESIKEQSRFDLVCLDIMMPEVDGINALGQIRKLEEVHGIGGLAGVKVIMTTALGDIKNVLSAFRQGCEAYVVKPFDREQLYTRLREVGIGTEESSTGE